ncbi:hypothetical protein I79_014017 [Cricetulus griseus]|uniref:Uncharacterized protein n=1 Tax=Cricetulus griseus TaxID=10029 RepID=G3HT16_CRIGR|nr:hypothetical protein I79_014017 [Cricetulus griseus]
MNPPIPEFCVQCTERNSYNYVYEKHSIEHKPLVYKKQSPCSLVSDSLGKDPLTSAMK